MRKNFCDSYTLTTTKNYGLEVIFCFVLFFLIAGFEKLFILDSWLLSCDFALKLKR